AIGHSQIAPPVGGSGGGGHVLGRMDAVHFACLREGEKAAAVEMRGKVVGTREPEAFLDGEEFVLNRHAFSGLGFATCPSQRLTAASVPGLTGVVDEKGAVVASEAPEGEAGGAGPLDGEARRERHRDEPGGTCANGFLDDLVGAAGGRQDEAVGWILACGGERADEL